MRNPVAGAERNLKLAGADGKGRSTHARHDFPKNDGCGPSDEAADYLLEVLTSARQLATARRFRFLAYLLGLAVEEARFIARTGESWASAWRDRSSQDDFPQE